MDFQTLARRDLQALCKRNRIPANMTNAAMADALRALSSVEGIAEIQDAMQYQSPKKSEATSPEIPRTGRRTSARRAPSREEPRERQASPLPRARRVTADASDIVMMAAEGEGPEEKQDAILKIPPTPASCAGQKKQAPATRKRVSNKAVAGVEVKEEAGIPPTPVSGLRPRRTVAAKVPDTPLATATATRSVRKTAVRRVAEAPKVEVKEDKTSVQRRARQPSSKKIEESGTATGTITTTARRSTRSRAIPKMASLGPEAEEQEVAAPANAGRKSARSNAAVKIESLVQEAKEQDGKDFTQVFDLCPNDPPAEMKEIKECETIQEPLDSDDGVQKPEDSPIKGLMEQGLEEKTPLAKPTVESRALIGELQPSAEEESDGVHLDFHPQETPLGDESPEEMVASVDQQLPTNEPKTDDVPAEADIPIDVPVSGEFDAILIPNVALEIEVPFDDNLTSPAVSPVKKSGEVEPILTGEVDVDSNSFEQEIIAPAEASLSETNATDEPESTILGSESSPVTESSLLELTITNDVADESGPQELEINAPIDDSLATETLVETKASKESESITLDAISSPLVLMPDVCSDSSSSPIKAVLADSLPESSPFQLAHSPGSNASPGPNELISVAGGSVAAYEEPSVGVDSELSHEHDKENKDAAGGEAKKTKSMAKKQNQHPVHYSRISLRKLKTMYKEKLISKKFDHKVELEVKRTALTALDENSL